MVIEKKGDNILWGMFLRQSIKGKKKKGSEEEGKTIYVSGFKERD